MARGATIYIYIHGRSGVSPHTQWPCLCSRLHLMCTKQSVLEIADPCRRNTHCWGIATHRQTHIVPAAPLQQPTLKIAMSKTNNCVNILYGRDVLFGTCAADQGRTNTWVLHTPNAIATTTLFLAHRPNTPWSHGLCGKDTGLATSPDYHVRLWGERGYRS